jgi:hypothetical protein
MINMGLDPSQVDRIYKSLFVYSVGFFDLLKKELKHLEPEARLHCEMHLWRVFSVLIEHTCRTDYQLLIARVQDQHREGQMKLTRKLTELIEDEQNQKK